MRIGVLLTGDEATQNSEWRKTCSYLSNRIVGFTFSYKLYNKEHLNLAIAQGEIEFVFTAPDHLIQLQTRSNITRLVSVSGMHSQIPFYKSSAVLFRTKPDSVARRKYSTSKTTLIAHKRDDFYGFTIAIPILSKPLGITSGTINKTNFVAQNYELVVHKTLKTPNAIGIVPAHVLHRMIQNKQVDINSIQILNKQSSLEYPFMHSTALYPTPSLAKLSTTSDHIARLVTSALLDPAGKQHWTLANSRKPVHGLLQQLYLPPYQKQPVALVDLLTLYWHWLLLVTLLFITIALASLYVVRRNKLLRRTQVSLQQEIQRRTQAEQNLIVVNRNLVHNLDQKTREANSISETLQKDNKIRQALEQKLLQQRDQLAHSGRVNTLGEMATGLAHELNSMLTAVINYIDACRNMVSTTDSTDPRVIDIMSQASTEARVASEIIKRMKNMIRKDQSHLVEVSINECAQQAVSLLSHEIKHQDATVELDLHPGNPVILADPVHIQQVIMNLVKNAIEAGSQSGTRNTVNIRTRVSEAVVLLDIIDQATPIDSETREKLFLPFFSTKSSGLGMGLALSRTIVESYDGKLCYDESHMNGNRFYVEFPQAA